MSAAAPLPAGEQRPESVSMRPLIAGLLVFLTVGVVGLVIWLTNRGTLCSPPSLPVAGLPSCATVAAWSVAGFVTFFGGLLTTIGLIVRSLRRPRADAPKSRIPGGWVGWAVVAVAITVVMAGVLGGSAYASQPGAPGASARGPTSTPYRSAQTVTVPAGQRQSSEGDTSFSFPASFAGYGGGWLNLTFSSPVAVNVCLMTEYSAFNESYSLCMDGLGIDAVSAIHAYSGVLSVSSEGGAVAFDAVSTSGSAADVNYSWTDDGSSSIGSGSITTQATGSGALSVPEGVVNLGTACVSFDLPTNNQTTGTLFVNATMPVSVSATPTFASGCNALGSLLSFGSGSGTSVALAISDNTGFNGSIVAVSLTAASPLQTSVTVTLVAEDTPI